MSERIEKFALLVAHIFSLLYDQFPSLVRIDKGSVLQTVFDFDDIYEAKRSLSHRQACREIVSTLIQSGTPHLTNAQRFKFEEILSSRDGINQDIKFQDKIRQMENRVKELSEILEGTITFLKSEGYIRILEEKWQLTEKGFAHLNKNFTEGTIDDVKETLISKIKDQILNPSKFGAQILLQIIGTLADKIP